MNTGVSGSLNPSRATDSGEGTTGTTGRPASPKRAWRRFVARRRAELAADYPCAAPTRRLVCPKHRIRVGSVTGICKPCRDELYEQLTAEYTAAETRQEGDAA